MSDIINVFSKRVIDLSICKENIFLTCFVLCRVSIYRYIIVGDYDQCSDDDGDPVLQDTKGMSMQEVVLMADNTSDENSPRADEPVQVISII